MHKDIIMEWVNNLRSGKYHQIQGNLYFNGCHCALGVLGETMGIHGDDLNKLPNNLYERFEEVMGSEHAVRKVFRLNDTHDKSFEYIADQIEKEYLNV